jgi:hypothetical protein
MWHRLGFCGEELVLGVALAVGAAGAMPAHDGSMRRIEDASFPIALPSIAVKLEAGRRRVAGRAVFGWSVCWQGAAAAERRCVEAGVSWRLPVLRDTE